MPKPLFRKAPLRAQLEARIIDLFINQKSSRQIASELSIGSSYVARILKENGLSRTISEANRIRQPPRSKHWRSSRQAARKTYERHYGVKLARDQHVHHIDHDFTNNDISNLTLMDAREHGLHHSPANPIPRHLRPGRREYMKKYLKEYYKRHAKTC